MGKILTICLSPVVQKTLNFDKIHINQVNRTNQAYTCIAGKGINTARALVSKGANVGNLTHLGGMYKKWFINQCKTQGIKLHWVDSFSEIRNCFTLLSSNGSTTELVQECPKVTKKCHKRVLIKFKKVLKNYDSILISGSLAKGYSISIYEEMVRLAKELNKTVFLDIVGEVLIKTLKYVPDYIKINQDEFERTFNECYDVVAARLAKQNIKLVVTNGSNDIKYYDGEVKFLKIENNSAPVNTTGCGDTFNAGFISSIIKGSTLLEAVKAGANWAYLNTKTVIPGDLG